jgi:hypothetical protein
MRFSIFLSYNRIWRLSSWKNAAYLVDLLLRDKQPEGVRHISKDNVVKLAGRDTIADLLTELQGWARSNWSVKR